MKYKIELKTFPFIEIAEQECEILEDYDIDFVIDAVDSYDENGECMVLVDISNLKEAIDLLGLNIYDFESELSNYENSKDRAASKESINIEEEKNIDKNSSGKHSELNAPIMKIEKTSLYHRYLDIVGERYSLASIIAILLIGLIFLFLNYFIISLLFVGLGFALLVLFITDYFSN